MCSKAREFAYDEVMKRILLCLLVVFGSSIQVTQTAIANPTFTVSPITVNPATVSIANGPATVSATISVVSTNPINQTRLPDPIFYQSGDIQGTRLGGKLSLISGTSTNGTYQVTVSIPATTLTGGWTVIVSAFTDTSGFSSTNGGYIANFRVNGGSSPNPTPTETNSSAQQTAPIASTKKTVTIPNLKKTTITCIKGKVTKKVTAVKPKCPAGYKKK